jgi:hypothetical protein
MKRTLLLAVLCLAFALSAGCSRKQPPPPAQPARISTTPAYERYFGPAPTSDKGSCFAFVIFFPSAGESGKVVPFPFFTFDASSLRKVAVERLLGGMEIGSYRGEFLNMPAGTRVVSFSESPESITVTLSREFSRAVQDRSADGAARAIALTLRQFKGVSTVRVLLEGSETPLDVQADEGTILAPGPPRLLSITAMRDKGARAIEEVNAFFDRPVEVRELRLLSKEGQQFAGDLFHSVFDMAAVLKPKDPSQFKEHMPIKVRWKVTDKLGRQAEGENVWLLEVKEHER